MRFLRSQRGAMFGMDARIALIIASILAATGGATMMSRLDRSKAEGAEIRAADLRDGLESYYTTISQSSLPSSLTAVISAGLVEDSNAGIDPWNNSWNYNTTTSSETLEGVGVTVQMAVIHSSGKDGVNDSTNITSESEFAAWAPANDDVGVKFSSISIEKARVRTYRKQARTIIDKVEAHETGRYLYADNTCTTTPSDSICSNGSPAVSYTQYNFYPRSDLDATSATYFDPTVTSSYQTYTAGNSADMEQLMSDVGLPTSYATDPWGRTLWYHSNITARTAPPFTASICFSSGGTCF